ncbi:MAG: hypothetical protein KY463_00240 [Actinobacteria bacterium]|nr:hypothetical protein [Actinomycetota bacterium]
MELVTILRVLARRWAVVAIGAALAVVTGVTLAPAVASKPAARVQIKVLVDTRASRVVNLGDGAEAIGTQAALLAQAMLDDSQRSAIARGAGIRPSDLGVSVASAVPRPPASPLKKRTEEVAAAPAHPFRLDLLIQPDVPIVTLTATAPSPSLAQRLAAVATGALEAFAASQAPTTARRLIVRPLGAVGSEVQRPGASPRLLAVGTVVLLFVLWCCAVIVVPPIVRLMRGGGGEERRRATPTATSRASSSSAG